MRAVDNVYDVAVINVPASLVTGGGFGNINTSSSGCGGALKGLIEILFTAAARAMDAPQKPPSPGVPPVVPPVLEGFYEVLRGERREVVGHRLFFVSHTQSFYFGDAIDDLFESNRADAYKAKKGPTASARQAAQAAETQTTLRNRGEGMAGHITNRGDFVYLVTKALGTQRDRELFHAVNQFPLRLDSNPLCPSVALGTSRQIPCTETAWAAAVARPCAQQCSPELYIGGPPPPPSFQQPAMPAGSAADDVAPSRMWARPAGTAAAAAATADDAAPAIAGVSVPQNRTNIEALLASTAARRTAPQQQSPSGVLSATVSSLLLLPVGASGMMPDFAQGPQLQARTLMFPDSSSVWWIPREILGKLWEYTRPDKCAPDPYDIASISHLMGSMDPDLMVTNEMASMATLDRVLAMRLINERELAELRAQRLSPEEHRTALCGWKRAKLDEFMTFFRTADTASITPEMAALRTLYERHTTTGKRTLVRRFTDIDPSLSPWGNLAAYLRTFSDHVLRSYATHVQLELIWLSCFNAYHWNPYHLQWSGLIPGDSGVSKSFTMLLVKRLLAEGTVTWVSDKTCKARRTAQNFNDGIIFRDEEASEAVSERNGQHIDDDPTDKSVMTSGIMTREQNVPRADGTRVTQSIAIPSSCVHWGAINNQTHNMSEPIKQRVHVMPFPSLAREGAFSNAQDEFILGEWSKDESLTAVALERFHILQLLAFLIENLIKIHVLDDVDVTLCKRLDMHFYAEMAASGVPVNRRDVERLNMNCREAAILDAANRLFLHCTAPFAEGAEWDPAWLMFVEPLLVVSEDVAAYVLGLHSVTLVPQDGQALLQHAIAVSNNVAPPDVDVGNPDTTYMPESFAEQLANTGGRAPGPPAPGDAPAAQQQQQQQDARSSEAVQLSRLARAAAAAGDTTAIAPPRTQCKVNRFDWLRLTGPIPELASRVHQHMSDPKPPLAVISSYLRKLAKMFVKVRNRDSTGNVITEESLRATAARRTLDHIFIESCKVGEHEVPAIICDSNSSRTAPVYVAQDLLAVQTMSPEDTVLRTLKAMCHRHTRPRRVLVGLPLTVDNVDVGELVRDCEGHMSRLSLADLHTGSGDGPSPSSSSRSPSRPGAPSADAVSRTRKFPQLSRVVVLDPVAAMAERVIVNPLTKQIAAVLYSFLGSPTETEKAWAASEISHVMAYNHDVETDLYVRRAMGLAIPREHLDVVIKLIPYFSEKVARGVCEAMGSRTVDYPSDLVKSYLQTEKEYRDPRRQAAIVPDIVACLAGVNVSQLITEIVRRMPGVCPDRMKRAAPCEEVRTALTAPLARRPVRTVRDILEERNAPQPAAAAVVVTIAAPKTVIARDSSRGFDMGSPDSVDGFGGESSKFSDRRSTTATDESMLFNSDSLMQ